MLRGVSHQRGVSKRLVVIERMRITSAAVFCLIYAARYMSVPSTAIALGISPIAPIASQFNDYLLVRVGEEINPRNRLGECLLRRRKHW